MRQKSLRLMSSVDNICEQFVPKSGQKENVGPDLDTNERRSDKRVLRAF